MPKASARPMMSSARLALLKLDDVSSRGVWFPFRFSSEFVEGTVSDVGVLSSTAFSGESDLFEGGKQESCGM